MTLIFTKVRSSSTLAVLNLIVAMGLSFDSLQGQGVHNLDTGESFTTIMRAIDDADTLNGHTISVDPGTYAENVYIIKELTLQSASGDPADTVIQGDDDFVIQVVARAVTIDGFTIQSNDLANGVGVGESYCTISNCIIRDNEEGISGWAWIPVTNTSILNNRVFNCSRHGIEVYSADDSIVSNNTVTNNGMFGIRVRLSDRTEISSNNVDGNSGPGLEIGESFQCLIADNVITNNGKEGLTLYHPTYATLTGNTMQGNVFNFFVSTGFSNPEFLRHNVDSTNTVEGKPIYYYVDQQGIQIPSDAGFVACVSCDDITAENLALANNGSGLLLQETTNSLFDNIDMSSGIMGVWASQCSNLTFTGINVSDFEDGFFFHDCMHITADSCEIKQCEVAIRNSQSNLGHYSNNLIENNENGKIILGYSHGNLIEDNTFRLNVDANVYLGTASTYNKILNNLFEQNGYCHIKVFGSPHNEILDNHMDGSEDSYYGMITLSASPETLISGNTLMNGTYYGIWCDEVTNCTISGNTFSQFDFKPAIWLDRASNNSIEDNIFRDSQFGLHLSESSDNEIRGNIYSYIWRGLFLISSNNNAIVDNSFLECTNVELMLDASNDNEVYHNDFLATTLRVYDMGTGNLWDNGYPSGGNYWSTYNGVDLDGDGIGDTSIEVLPVGNNNYDRYPLMTPANLTFFTDKATLSETAGGQINLYAEAGHGNAFRKYLVVGGLSGTDPGQPLPGGLATLPVNFDAFTHYVVFPYLNTVLFTNFLGILDEDGRAHPVINAPPVPGFAGNTMHYAFCCNNPFDFASNAVAIDIVP